PAANTTNKATLHPSFINVILSPYRRDAAGLYSAAPTARSTRADRVSGPPRQHWLVASQSDATGGSPMTVGARRMFAGASAVSLACLVMTASLRAQTAAERVPMVEETFKTVQLLRGIPVDTFFEVMGTFASSMGNDCTFCHASNAALDKS